MCIRACEFYNGTEKPERFTRSDHIIEVFIIVMSIIYTYSTFVERWHFYKSRSIIIYLKV